jgi:crotonobetainyl-CoA:carnitine CoA-transferase CaiB-like acyl-CoA transferase
MPTAEVVEKLDAAGVPVGPIYTVPQLFADPQAQATRLQRTIQHPTAGEISVTGFPYRFSNAELEITSSPPLLGQQTRELLAEAGYSPEEIDALIASGAAAES